MKRFLLFMTVIFLLFSSGNLYASVEQEHYIGARIGMFLPNKSGHGLKDHNIGINHEYFYNYRINRNFAIEVTTGYYRSDLDETSAEEFNKETLISFPFTCTGIGIWPIDNHLELYGGAGLGLYLAFLDYSRDLGNNPESDKKSDFSFGWHLLGGADLNVTDNVAVSTQLQWFRVRPDFGEGKRNVGGTTLNLGLKFRF